MYFVFKERIDSGNIVSVTYLNVEGTVNIALYFINTESICSVVTLWWVISIEGTANIAVNYIMEMELSYDHSPKYFSSACFRAVIASSKL